MLTAFAGSDMGYTGLGWLLRSVVLPAPPPAVDAGVQRLVTLVPGQGGAGGAVTACTRAVVIEKIFL